MLLVVVGAQAQRIGCVHDFMQTRADDTGYSLAFPFPFDPQKVYHQPVILISFNDADFSMDNPVAYYDSLFNEPGFNKGVGSGCVADYFRDQSGGRANIQFDIYGPVKVDQSVKKSICTNMGDAAMREALRIMSNTGEYNFSIYDWDGNQHVNQVLFVAASYTGAKMKGYIYPNTGHSYFTCPGSLDVDVISITSELWQDGRSCGLGTIIHEYLHCLGLPDIYPLAPATSFSTVDEWDVMDGGNYTNYGWCPPNLSSMELMHLGWAKPIELTEPMVVEGMKSMSDGGPTYIIRSPFNPNEFYLLENRQQKGWDYACPGNGLLIFHVDYDYDMWMNNKVNVSDTHYRYDLFHADGKAYKDWNPENDGNDTGKYTMDNSIRSRYFSTSPYPYTNPQSLEVNDRLSNGSKPAAKLFTSSNGLPFMSKPITNIRMADDGTISFVFMNADQSGVSATMFSDQSNDAWFTIDGRSLPNVPTAMGFYIHGGEKVIIR